MDNQEIELTGFKWSIEKYEHPESPSIPKLKGDLYLLRYKGRHQGKPYVGYQLLSGGLVGNVEDDYLESAARRNLIGHIAEELANDNRD